MKKDHFFRKCMIEFHLIKRYKLFKMAECQHSLLDTEEHWSIIYTYLAIFLVHFVALLAKLSNLFWNQLSQKAEIDRFSNVSILFHTCLDLSHLILVIYRKVSKIERRIINLLKSAFIVPVHIFFFKLETENPYRWSVFH